MNDFTLSAQILSMVALAVVDSANPDLQLTDTGWEPAKVYSPSNDAVRTAFGKHITAKDPMTKWALTTYAQMLLRQGNPTFSIPQLKENLGKEIYSVHPGSDLLKVMFPNVIFVDEPLTEEIKEASLKAGFHYKTTMNDLNAVHLASEGSKVVVANSFSPDIYKFKGDKSNFISLPNSWGTYCDFVATIGDAAYVAKSFSVAYGQESVGFFKSLEKENTFFFTLDQQTFRIDLDGVWDDSRNRRFGAMALVSSPLYDIEHPYSEEDICRTNSYGTFIYALLSLGCGVWSSPSKLFRVMTSGEYVPLSNLEEIGVMDADRVRYDRYVTVAKVANLHTPFKLVNTQEGTHAVSADPLVHSVSKVPGKLANNAMFSKYNLVQMPQGQYIDGRASVFRFSDIPQDHRLEIVGKMFRDANVCPMTWVNKKFGTTFFTSTEALEWLSVKGSLLLSNKLNKAVKRTSMADAQVGPLKNGESRCYSPLRHVEDIDASSNNVALKAVISLSHIQAAGTACYLVSPESLNEQMDKLTMEVNHTQSYGPGIPFTGDALNDIEFEYAPDSTSKKGKWFSAKYSTPKFVRPGETVAMFPYEVEGGNAYYPVPNTQADAYLSEIHWAEVPGNGKDEKVLAFKVVTLTYERELKARNNVKAMMTQAPMDLIYNGLNGDIVAEALFPRDTNKWTDLVCKYLDVAAMTFIKNGHKQGLELITEVNSYVGYEGCDKLVFSPAAAVYGTYQPILDLFDEIYGRPVWTKTRDSKEGDLTKVLFEMYKGWTRLEASSNVIFPEGSTQRVLLSQDGTSLNDESNLLAFYNLDGVNYILQCGWAYAGDSVNGPVWQPIKGEVSSVASVVGTTRAMAGVTRSISKFSAETSRAMSESGYNAVHLQGAFIQMLSNQAIGYGSKLTQRISLQQLSSVLSDEVKAACSDPSQHNGLLTAIAKELKQYTIQMNEFTLYIPAIAKQSANNNFSGFRGLSDLVQTLVVCTINGASGNFSGLENRIKGALEATASGDSLGKSAAYGQMGVQAKAAAPAIGVPVNELWVRVSTSERSVYATMKRTYGYVDGAEVALTRAPMVTPLFATVRVIDIDHWAFAYVGEFSVACSTLAMTLNGGDFDGDNVAMFKVTNIPMTTLDDMIQSLVRRTGSSQLVPGGSYWGDHLEILSYEKQCKKSGKTADSLLSHIAISDKHDNEKVSLPILFSKSAEAFQEHVSLAHSFFLKTEIATSLSLQTSNIVETEHFANLFDKEGLDEVSAEMYEVPLGGLDWNAHKFFSYMQESFGNSTEIFASAIAKSDFGINPEFSEALESASVGYILTKDMQKLSSYGTASVSNWNDVMVAITTLTFAISKNQVSEKHDSMIDALMGFARENVETWKALCIASPVVDSINNWIRVVYGAGEARAHLVDVDCIC